MPRLADAFRQAGVEVVPIELPQSQLEGELRSGRRFDLALRVLKCEEPVLEAGRLLCPGYDAPPEADALASATSVLILQLLLQLERAADWQTRAAWPSRSIASHVTSCRSFPSGSSATTMPGETD